MSLRMAYVEASNQPAPPQEPARKEPAQPAGAKEGAQPAATPSAETPPKVESAGGDSESHKRFTKKY